MNLFSHIIVTAFLAGVVASVIATVSGGVTALIFIRNMGIFSNGSSYKTYEKLVTAIAIPVFIASLLICPYTAYSLRESVFEYTDNWDLRIVLFAFVALSQIIMLISAYCALIFIYKYVAEKVEQNRAKERAAFFELGNKLDSAGVKVTVSKSKILNDNGKIIDAEFILQIENVPLIISVYELEFFKVEDHDEGFAVPFYKLSDLEIPNPKIKAVNQNGKWIFIEMTTNKIVSESADRVPLSVEFFRTTAPASHLPTTMVPRLGIWKREDNEYTSNHIFFLKPIPVEFETNNP